MRPNEAPIGRDLSHDELDRMMRENGGLPADYVSPDEFPGQMDIYECIEEAEGD